MSRRELRERIFKMLFRVEFHPESEMKEQLKVFLEENEPMDEEDENYIRQKYEAVKEKLTEIDENINAHTTGWKTDRMGKAELTIIRLAVYEMLYDEDVPTSVAINEAVELAKKYGTDEAPAFVNGVLAKIA
ncbi:MAG: transcription antitermination factor NusB [Lachnospiraceae bacterium]|jgi:N utilization substance protein B|nr:transcription antitermination factor NusB [Lachnospiraceae bacterium]